MFKKNIKIIFVLLVLLMVNTSFSQNSATKLNAIGVLDGDGTSFNLDNSLKRQDASAFIVKFLGLKDVVLDNAALKNRVNFNDIEAGEWFVPYINYLDYNDIINGYEDNTFRPKEKISEKAFLKMLLVTLGYEYETDFNWNNVYTTAYEIGLTDDISYTVKTDDNTNFRRRDVVNFLDTALTLKIKDENKYAVERLIDNNITTEKKVLSLGYNISPEESEENIDEETNQEEYDLKDIEISGKNSITFSIDNIDNSLFNNNSVNYKIIDTKIDQSLSIVSIDRSTEDKITLSFYEELAPGDYKVSVYFRNDDIKYSNVITKEGTVQQDYYTKNFDIYDIITLNNQEIEVIFTHPITENSSREELFSILRDNNEIISGNYRSINVYLNPNNPNSLIISLIEEKLYPNTTYQLRVNGSVESKYLVHLNSGNGATKSFIANDEDSSSFKLVNLKVLNDDTLRLEFNRTLDENDALDVNNYSMFILNEFSGNYPKADSVTWAFPNNRKVIDLNFENMKVNSSYKLNISSLRDFNDNSILEDFNKTFTCEYTNTVEHARIRLIEVVNNKTIKVDFYNELGSKSKNANISIPNETISEVYINDNNPYQMIIHLSSELLEHEKKFISIDGNLYNSDNELINQAVYSNTFYGSNEIIEPVKIQSIDFLGEGVLKIDFDRLINLNQSTYRNNYHIYFKNNYTDNRSIVPQRVVYLDNNSLLLKFDEIRENDVESVLIENFNDDLLDTDYSIRYTID